MILEVWLARDENNELFIFYKDKPIKYENQGVWRNNNRISSIPKNYFPNIKWEDNEPVKAEIVINK